MIERNFLTAYNLLVLASFISGYFSESMSFTFYNSLITLLGFGMIVVAVWSAIWMIKNPIKKKVFNPRTVAYQEETKKK